MFFTQLDRINATGDSRLDNLGGQTTRRKVLLCHEIRFVGAVHGSEHRPENDIRRGFERSAEAKELAVVDPVIARGVDDQKILFRER